MKANQDIAILDDDIILVPYRKEHVGVYHEWMKSAELQELTASEPLSWEEELAMQESWALDEEKCTFIILSSQMKTDRIGPFADRAGMIGDVNLYLNDMDNPRLAELELMIAEPSMRRKGYGRTVALMMMSYAVHSLGLTHFRVKIGLQNHASRQLFEGLGFKTVSLSEVFQEVTMELQADANPLSDLLKKDLNIVPCKKENE